MEIGTKPNRVSWKYKFGSMIITGVLYSAILFAFDYFSNDKLYSTYSLIFQGVFFGIATGLGFPLITEKFGGKFTSKLGGNVTPVLSDTEEIEISGPANLFRGIEATGGKLFLTNKNVIFKSHTMNIQKGQTNIQYDNIKEILLRKTAKLIDNGIRITTKDGKNFDFVVNEREQWMQNLSKRIKTDL